MKKVFVLFALMFVSLTTSAQRLQYKTEADALKGTSASSYHAVKIPGKGIVSIDDNIDSFSFQTFEGVFDYEKYKSYFTVVKGIFGMYGEDGNLVDKAEVLLGVTEKMPDFATADGTRNYPGYDNSGVKKVASWVRNNKGSVRFIIPRYGKIDFDVTLPTLLSNKIPSDKPKGNAQNKTPKRPVRK